MLEAIVSIDADTGLPRFRHNCLHDRIESGKSRQLGPISMNAIGQARTQVDLAAISRINDQYSVFVGRATECSNIGAESKRDEHMCDLPKQNCIVKYDHDLMSGWRIVLIVCHSVLTSGYAGNYCVHNQILIEIVLGNVPQTE